MASAPPLHPRTAAMIEHAFSHDDVRSFALLSGDANPVHCDPVYARRTLFGQQIVHGVYLAMWSLDQVAAQWSQAFELSTFKADFKEAVPLDTSCALYFTVDESGAVRIRIESNGKTAASVRATFSVVKQRSPMDLPSRRAEAVSPCMLSRDQIAMASGEVPLHLDKQLAAQLFPHLCQQLPHDQLATLLACTYVVGMKCPGLHSIYVSLEMTFDYSDASPSGLSYSVSDFDERFALLTLDFSTTAAKGTSKALLRPPPQDQVRFSEITQVDDNAFADQRALVVGGSRGVGEVTAKLLAAGGADVRITYYQGAGDAQRIVDEIVAGGGRADCVRYDVLDATPSLAEQLSGWVPSHLYYFATPPIFSATSTSFSPALFQKFCDYYVSGFQRTFDEVRALGDGLRVVYYPSSTAIDEQVPSMGEYIAAKSAGEALCASLSQASPALKIVTSRLGRLATDQTRTLAAVDNADPMPIMLEELRRLDGH